MSSFLTRMEKKWFNRQIIVHYNEDSIAELEKENERLKYELSRNETDLRREILELKDEINDILYYFIKTSKEMWKYRHRDGHLHEPIS